MTEPETEMIRNWVQGGGTLITSAETSLYDEWGRKRDDFALSGLFGAHYSNTCQGVARFEWGDIPVLYDIDQDYVRVAVAPDVEVAAKWENGDPALLGRKAGKGQIWFLTMRRPGLTHRARGTESALFARARRALGMCWPS